MLDYGYPQITQTESLKLFIKGQGEKSEVAVNFFFFFSL